MPQFALKRTGSLRFPLPPTGVYPLIVVGFAGDRGTFWRANVAVSESTDRLNLGTGVGPK